MDNVVQNIKIEDIVPRSHHKNTNSFKELEELAISIKDNGIKEPLVVNKKNDRYEIISGNKRYKAAILAGLSELPVIVKDYNEDILLNYNKKNDDISLSSIKNDSDIVNLSELSKEYERDDLNMNNELMNNNNIGLQNNNVGEAPAFGGRFFPSLEDLPTNMSLNTSVSPTPESVSQTNVVPNNNLIDLTDTSNEPINLNNITMEQQPQVNNPITPPQPETIMNNNNLEPNNGNILNLENLTQNNSMVQTPQTTTGIPTSNVNIDNKIQDEINNFQTNPNLSNNLSTPVIASNTEPVSQNLGITPNVEVVPTIDPMSTSINIPGDIVPTPVEQSVIPTPQAPVIPQTNPIIQPNIITPSIEPQPVVQQEIVKPTPAPVEQTVQQKDVLPVINTLKAVGVNLESFGYTVRITDENLPTSYKITIEVEK